MKIYNPFQGRQTAGLVGMFGDDDSVVAEAPVEFASGDDERLDSHFKTIARAVRKIGPAELN
jgi:hypothetical protein